MNIQTLRYVVEIEDYGSINKAAQQLFVSQSTLSRAIQEIEEETGFIIFQRSHKGVIATHEGRKIIDQAKKIFMEIDTFESRFSLNRSLGKEETSLRLGVQRAVPAITAFLQVYEEYEKDAEFLNMVLYESSKNQIVKLVHERILDIGVVHYLSKDAEEFTNECESIGLEHRDIYESPICIQVRGGHPLAKYDTITLDKLKDYTRIAFLDEDLTQINYCSDVLQFDRNLLKKRIVVQERGTQRELLAQTDGYYIGNFYDTKKLEEMGIYTPVDVKCIPLHNTNTSIIATLVYRKNYKFHDCEQRYMEAVEHLLNDMKTISCTAKRVL